METDLMEVGLSLLNSVALDANIVAATALYTGPADCQFIVTHLIVRPASAGFTTLAACNDVDFGKVGATTDWANAATLAALIDADKCIILKSPETWEAASPIYDAGEVFQMDIQTGAAAGSNVIVDVIGKLNKVGS